MSNSNEQDKEEPQWFAVYTRFKREKYIQKRLEEKGITAYVPLRKLTRRYTRKVRIVNLPLISCYVFVHIAKREYIPVLETADVVGFVKFSQKLAAIPDTEIALLKQIVREGTGLEAEPIAFRKGDEVEITSGNLAGIRGILADGENNKNLLIDFERIGYTLRMQVDPAILRKLRPEKSAGR